jgi:hypothetical protein
MQYQNPPATQFLMRAMVVLKALAFASILQTKNHGYLNIALVRVAGERQRNASLLEVQRILHQNKPARLQNKNA